MNWSRFCLSSTDNVSYLRSSLQHGQSLFCFQGLFHRVLREEISLSKLVRMKPEELLSKELSVWKEKPAKAVSSIIFPCVLKYKLRTSLLIFTIHYALMHHFLPNEILIALSFNTLFPYHILNDSKVQSKINIWSFYQPFCFFQTESRSKSHEIKKMAVKREHVPAVNMEDSPPVSDSDVSTGAVPSAWGCGGGEIAVRASNLSSEIQMVSLNCEDIIVRWVCYAHSSSVKDCNSQ